MKVWPEVQQEKVLSFVQQKDYNATFFGKVLLEYAFRENGQTLDWDDVVYNEKEKPYIKNSEIDFNLSHSGKYVALAIGNGLLGIDIEMHRSVRLDLFNRQFQEDEWQKIRSSEDSLEQFFLFWAIKEAAIKADGRGVEVLSKTHILSDNQIQIEEKVWNYQSFYFLKGYSMAICAELPFKVNEKDINFPDTDKLLG